MADIITLAGTFKSQKELQAYADAQYLALKGAHEKIKKLEEEVTHLQTMLAANTALIEDSRVERLIKTPELAIIEAQIQILQNRAMQKELTLEEVKTLDLLIKNKKLLSDEPTAINGSAKKKRTYTDAELIEKAKQIENKNE